MQPQARRPSSSPQGKFGGGSRDAKPYPYVPRGEKVVVAGVGMVALEGMNTDHLPLPIPASPKMQRQSALDVASQATFGGTAR